MAGAFEGREDLCRLLFPFLFSFFFFFFFFFFYSFAFLLHELGGLGGGGKMGAERERYTELSSGRAEMLFLCK